MAKRPKPGDAEAPKSPASASAVAVEDEEDPQSKPRFDNSTVVIVLLFCVGFALVVLSQMGQGTVAQVSPVPGPSDATLASRGAGISTNPVAFFNTTMGSFQAEIFLDRVPITASSFIDLCKTGFYNGLHFHRVIPNFMDQFGCPYSRDPKSSRAGTGGPEDGTFANLKTGAVERRSGGGNIRDELISRDSNVRGTLSMANTGSPNSGGSQFFLNVNDNTFLDWFSGGSSKHPVFGRITEGYGVVQAISEVATRQDNPVTPIMMKSIIIHGA
jgi:cyclophilin family peptidyl-prolyl cis-trans isomerase